MPNTEMENAIIASVKDRFGLKLDLENEPGVLLEIIRTYKDDVQRTHAAPHEYVQVETGAVGGVSMAESFSGAKASVSHDSPQKHVEAIAGEITNSELMRELLRIRKVVDRLDAREPPG